jgi:hypothetical protein
MTTNQDIERVMIELGDSFLKAVEAHNEGRIGKKTPLDDDTEPSFENFIRWLRFKRANLL